MYSLRLLGGASIDSGSGPLVGAVAQRRRLALLALLAATPVGAVSRERVAALLFPEENSDRARHGLSNALHAVRKSLGRDAILAVGDELRLNAEFLTSDLAEFERAVATGDHERAAALYQGPFLDGFAVPHAAEFERWVEDVRQRLAQQYSRSLEAAAEALEGAKDMAGAAKWWQRLALQDLCNSRVTLRLCHALYASSDPAGALRWAQLHAARLRDDFGAEPAPEVVAILNGPSKGPLADRSLDPLPVGGESTVPRVVAPETVDAPSAQRIGDVLTPPVRRRRSIVWTAGMGLALTIGTIVATNAEVEGPRSLANASTTPAPRSVAVMRFRNISGAAEDRYFADGISEEIIQTLALLDSVQVAARSSSFALSTDTLTARDVGRRLGVETLVEGGVRRDGDSLRVSVRLIDAADGYTRWSDTFERPAVDMFAMQEAIARAIAGALSVRLSEGKPLISPRRTTNAQTYDHYLRGRYLWWNAQSEQSARERTGVQQGARRRLGLCAGVDWTRGRLFRVVRLLRRYARRSDDFSARRAYEGTRARFHANRRARRAGIPSHLPRSELGEGGIALQTRNCTGPA